MFGTPAPLRAPDPAFLASIDQVLAGAVGPQPSPIQLAMQSGGPAPRAPSADPRGSSFGSGAPISPPRSAASVNVTDPTRYGRIPAVFGVPTPALSQAPAPASALATPASSANAGMFAGKPHHGLDWRAVVGALSQAALAFSASRGNPAALNMLDNLQQMQRLREEAEAKRAQDDLEYQRKLQEPRTVGDNLVVPDGAGGFKTAFSAPSPAETYASNFGEPGSDEYRQAMQDYILKGYSDPAIANRESLSGYNFDRRDVELGQRLATVRRGQDFSHQDRQSSIAQSNTNNLRSTSTSSANNIRSTSQSNINNQRSTQTSAANAQLTNQTRLQTARHVRVLPNEPVATDANGNKLVVRDGQWVPAR